MDLLQSLKRALEFEEKGYILYQNVVAEIKDDRLKKFFLFLANEEIIHGRHINFFLKNKYSKIVLDDERNRLDKNERIFLLKFEKLKERLKSSKMISKAFEIALEFENSAKIYYTEQLAFALDEETKNLLSYLVEQEERHYNILKKAKENLSL